MGGLFNYSVINQDREVIAEDNQVNQIPNLTNVLAAGQYKRILNETNLDCQISSDFEVGSIYQKNEDTYVNGLRCSTEEIVINGNTYNTEKRTGQEILKSVNGCDSTVVIDLDFLEYELEVTNMDSKEESTGRIKFSASVENESYNYTLRDKFNDVVLSGPDQPSIFDSESVLSQGKYQLEISSTELGCVYETNNR